MKRYGNLHWFFLFDELSEHEVKVMCKSNNEVFSSYTPHLTTDTSKIKLNADNNKNNDIHAVAQNAWFKP